MVMTTLWTIVSVLSGLYTARILYFLVGMIAAKLYLVWLVKKRPEFLMERLALKNKTAKHLKQGWNKFTSHAPRYVITMIITSLASWYAWPL